MKITCFECDEHERALLEKALPYDELTFHEPPLELENLKNNSFTEVLVIFIYSKITREVLAKFPFLRLIVTLSTGYDHIDVQACKEHGITVCNVPKYGGTAVAEHTFALMLALLRHIPRAVHNTNHDDFSLTGLCGTELAGKTLGVIGAGTIGSAVIRRARAFEMNVLMYERTPNKQLAKETGAQHTELNDLLKKSDIITLHLPYTKQTHHLLDKRKTKLIKPGAYLINTARGALVDTHALSEALRTKKIAGAALDVLEGEIEHREAHAQKKEHHLKQHDWSTIRETHRLLKLPNVLITPHMAFYTHEATQTIIETAAKNIRAFQKGVTLNAVS